MPVAPAALHLIQLLLRLLRPLLADARVADRTAATQTVSFSVTRPAACFPLPFPLSFLFLSLSFCFSFFLRRGGGGGRGGEESRRNLRLQSGRDVFRILFALVLLSVVGVVAEGGEDFAGVLFGFFGCVCWRGGGWFSLVGGRGKGKGVEERRGTHWGWRGWLCGRGRRWRCLRGRNLPLYWGGSW